jgi:two-component system, OmpR family, response regulator
MGQRRLSVLVADDDVVGLRFLAECMTTLDHDCTAVSDGPAALAAARATRFDLLLLDLNMPGLGGRALLRSLRADHDARSQRSDAVAMSADLSSGLARELRTDGFIDALRKPLSFAQLERLVDASAPAGPAAAVLPAHDPSPSGPLADLDDEAALRAVGSSDVLDGLRALFATELPGQLALIEHAQRLGDHAAVRDILHRLRSSCRFCGAVALHEAAMELDRSEPGANRERAWSQLQTRAATLIQRMAAGSH